MILAISHYERVCGDTPQLDLFGRFPQKTEIIDRIYDHVALSLVLSGNGFLKHSGKNYAIQSPCAFMINPYDRFHYGPEKTWDEVFYTFSIMHNPADLFHRWNLDANKIVWPIRRPSRIRKIVDFSHELCASIGMKGVVDQLDRVAEMALIESLWGQETKSLSAETLGIYKAEEYIRANYRKEIKISELLDICNFSARTFRRYWNAIFTISPIKLINKFRLDEAAELLVETDMGIAQIGYKVGYEDPLYFTRIFCRYRGVSPMKYRIQKR